MSLLLTLPAVDGVEITTIMDNSLDLIMSSTPVARRFPLQKYGFTGAQLRAEHGVSLLITVIDQGKRETILFDTGVTPEGALHNIEVLGIDLSSIQAIVLSHGHTDHTHGLEREGIELLVERGPSFVINGKLLVTGQIERTTDFEQGLKNQQAEIDGTWQPDPWVYDDQAIVINVRNKGLVVATGCGHAGVINILRQARSQTGIEQIYALLGGFHLSGALFEPIIPQTVEALQQIKPAVVVPAHCTGWRATQRIAQAMPDAYTPNSVGTTFVLMGQ